MGTESKVQTVRVKVQSSSCTGLVPLKTTDSERAAWWPKCRRGEFPGHSGCVAGRFQSPAVSASERRRGSGAGGVILFVAVIIIITAASLNTVEDQAQHVGLSLVKQVQGCPREAN